MNVTDPTPSPPLSPHTTSLSDTIICSTPNNIPDDPRLRSPRNVIKEETWPVIVLGNDNHQTLLLSPPANRTPLPETEQLNIAATPFLPEETYDSMDTTPPHRAKQLAQTTGKEDISLPSTTPPQSDSFQPSPQDFTPSLRLKKNNTSPSLKLAENNYRCSPIKIPSLDQEKTISNSSNTALPTPSNLPQQHPSEDTDEITPEPDATNNQSADHNPTPPQRITLHIFKEDATEVSVEASHSLRDQLLLHQLEHNIALDLEKSYYNTERRAITLKTSDLASAQTIMKLFKDNWLPGFRASSPQLETENNPNTITTIFPKVLREKLDMGLIYKLFSLGLKTAIDMPTNLIVANPPKLLPGERISLVLTVTDQLMNLIFNNKNVNKKKGIITLLGRSLRFSRCIDLKIKKAVNMDLADSLGDLGLDR